MFLLIYFFRLGKFSFILWKIFSGYWNCNSAPSSFPIILSLNLFMVSQISWIYCLKNFLELTFSLINVLFFLFYLLCLIFSLPCPVLCCWCFLARGFCFPYWCFHFQILNSFIYFLHQFSGIFLYSIRDLFDTYLKLYVCWLYFMYF